MAGGSFTNATMRSTADDLYLSFVLDTVVIDAAYSMTVMRALVKNDSIAGQPTNAKKYPRWPGLAAASVAENADLANTEIATTGVTITVGEIGILISLTDALQEDDILAGAAEYGAQGGKAVADKMDADIAALLASHSNTVGTTSVPVDLTEANFLLAIQLLEAADAPRPYVAVFHPFTIAQLRNDIVTSGNAGIYGGSAPQDGRFGSQAGAWQFNLFGVDVYASTNVVEVDAGTPDYYPGAMFSRGQAHAFLAKREVRTELDRDASMRLTELNITSRYGVGELVDAYGVSILTTDA